MHVFLLVAWVSVASLFAARISSVDPAFAKQIEATDKVLQSLGSQQSQPGEAEIQKTIESLAPILARLDLFGVGMCVSLMVFTLLGFLVARWLNSTDWLGIMPIFALISGTSPSTICISLASQGVPSAALSPIQHGLLLGIQLICVYACGALGLRLKQSGKPNPAPPPEQV